MFCAVFRDVDLDFEQGVMSFRDNWYCTGDYVCIYNSKGGFGLSPASLIWRGNLYPFLRMKGQGSE